MYMYPLNLCEIMRDLVMPRWIWLCLVEFGYASLNLVMYPMNLCEIMRDLVMPLCCFVGFGYASLLFRWIWLCLVVALLDSVMFRLSLLFRLCSYSWLCIVYYINDTILYKGYCLWFDLVLLIDTPCHRPVMLYIQSYVLYNYLKNFLCIYSITGRWQQLIV